MHVLVRSCAQPGGAPLCEGSGVLAVLRVAAPLGLSCASTRACMTDEEDGVERNHASSEEEAELIILGGPSDDDNEPLSKRPRKRLRTEAR